MAEPERVHVFGGSPRLLESRHILRVMVRCLTGDASMLGGLEGLAATYDEMLGGNDALVGCNMTMFVETSSDPREYVERVMMACDLLRQARRTAH